MNQSSEMALEIGIYKMSIVLFLGKFVSGNRQKASLNKSPYKSLNNNENYNYGTFRNRERSN